MKNDRKRFCRVRRSASSTVNNKQNRKIYIKNRYERTKENYKNFNKLNDDLSWKQNQLKKNFMDEYAKEIKKEKIATN